MCKGPEAWLVCLRNAASEKESKGDIMRAEVSRVQAYRTS